jgi:hypothetical protein
MFVSSKLILLVVACGSTFVDAQTAPSARRTPATVTSTRRAKGAVAAGPSTGSLARQKPVPIVLEYLLFIAEKASDHKSIQEAIRENPNRFPPDIELQDMSMHIGIRPEEYAIILAHILDANDRLNENQTDWQVAFSNFRTRADPSAKSIPPPQLIALSKEHKAVISGTIASLKHELGNKSFHKLNTWVDLNYIAETSVPAPGTGPNRPKPVVNPSTEQAPVIVT